MAFPVGFLVIALSIMAGTFLPFTGSVTIMYLGALLSEDGEKVFNVIFFFRWPSFKTAIVESFIRTIKNKPKKEKRKSTQKS